MPTRGGAAKVTTDHDFIRSWVEERGGCPAQVKRTSGRGTGIIRIDYPGFSGQQTLEKISWREFFDKFEESGLAFLYQEQTAAGRPSRFSKLVARESVEDGKSSTRSRRSTTTRRSASARSTPKRAASSAGRTAKSRGSAGRRTASTASARSSGSSRSAGASGSTTRGRTSKKRSTRSSTSSRAGKARKSSRT